jgi:Flp pilus assembly protein CpaB
MVQLALRSTDENHYRQRLLQGRDLFFGHQRRASLQIVKTGLLNT